MPEAGRKFCVAVGPSREGQAALEWAAKKLIDAKDEVYLLQVVPAVTTQADATAGDRFWLAAGTEDEKAPVEADATALKNAKETLGKSAEAVKKLVPDATVKAVPAVGHISSSADVGRTLIQATDKCGCESLVIGSRGLGLSRRAMFNLFGLGSVSDHVVRHAPFSVIVHKQTL
eukprot:scaffold13.g165.t1